MTTATERTRGPGDLLADRYRLDDLLQESHGGRFWLAHDLVLSRAVAVHVIDAADPRAPGLLAAARRSAVLVDRRLLRVLDAEARDGVCFVVTEWAEGTSLDVLLNDGPLEAERAAWVTAEVGAALAAAHAIGHAHGRLLPEGVLIDRSGTVRVMGFAVDAALVGLAPGSAAGDVADLAAILYAALTGRWPGRAPSERVPEAPREAGRVLRARQVRAGVPTALDALCDQVLGAAGPARGNHARMAHDLATAAGITAGLQEFIGDPTPIAQTEAGAALGRLAAAAAISLPPEVPRTRPPSEVANERLLGTPDPGDTPGDTAERPAAALDPDLTQAGVPIFHADSAGGTEVSWFSPRPETPPPPPPFEATEPKPLFAPESGKGGAHRRPPTQGGESRYEIPPHEVAPPSAGQSEAPSGAEFWPWASTRQPRAALETPAEAAITDPPVPGRAWLRMAGIVAATLLLLLAVVAAYNMGRGLPPLGGDATRTADLPSALPGAVGEPLTIVSVRDFDPEADPQQERPDLVPLAFDGDPATAWRTEVYEQNFGPNGLKSGLGLVLDLGEAQDITMVAVEFNGETTSVAIDVSAQAPQDAAAVTPITQFEAGETLRAKLPAPVSGRYVTVWLTSLPAVERGFRAEIAEVVVRG